MQIPYPRPQKFSDPFGDFSQEELKQILSVPNEQMGWNELGLIFQTYLPAGVYQECVYFVPYLIKVIWDEIRFQKNIEGIIDLINCYIIWSDHNIQELMNDNLWEQINRTILDWFICITAEFAIKDKYNVKNDLLLFQIFESLNKTNNFIHLDKMMLIELKVTKTNSSYSWALYIYNYYCSTSALANYNYCFFNDIWGKCYINEIYDFILKIVCFTKEPLVIDFWDNNLKYFFIMD